MECSGGEQAMSAGEDCATGPETTEPYTVLRCNDYGNPADTRRSEGDPACFAINWNEHGGDAFEFERLERPELDDSARLAQLRAAESVSHTLQECIDVCCPRVRFTCSVVNFASCWFVFHLPLFMCLLHCVACPLWMLLGMCQIVS